MKRLKLPAGLILAGIVCTARPALAQTGAPRYLPGVNKSGGGLEASDLVVAENRTIDEPGASANRPPIQSPSAPTVDVPSARNAAPGVGSPAARAMNLTNDAPAASEPLPLNDHHDDQPRWSIFADLLILSARGETIPYGQVRDGVGPLAVPRGPVGEVDSNYSAGFRIGVERALSSGTNLYGGVSWFQTRNNSHLDVPAGQPFVIHALTTFPGTDNAAADSLAADANLTIRYVTGDLGFKMNMCGSDCFGLDLILGARYAHLDQDFLGTYSILGSTTVATNINFDGGGPRVGLEGHYFICRSIFLYARSDISLLFGHFGASYLQQNVFTGVQAETQFGDDRLVPVWENEFGIGWRSANHRIEVMAGYSAAIWFNTMTTSNWILGVQDSAFSTSRDNLRDTLTFDGLFVRAGFRF